MEPSGELLQLNSYENRVYQARREDGSFVVAKFYRPHRWTDPQILEEHQFAQALAEAEIPLAVPLTLQTARPTSFISLSLLGSPATLASSTLDRVAVFPRLGGRAPELEQEGVLQRLGFFLGRLHSVGQRQLFQHRRSWLSAEPGRQAVTWLNDHDIVPLSIEPSWRALTDQALELIQNAFDRLPDLRSLRLHGDCHLGNVLWTEAGGPHFVDLDDACNGPAIQDLWMLLSGDMNSMRAQLMEVLDGYETFCPFDWREMSLIEPLRTLRLLHHSAWIAQRWKDPAFPVAFPWFAEASYWQTQCGLLREQIAIMQEQRDQPLWG